MVKMISWGKNLGVIIWENKIKILGLLFITLLTLLQFLFSDNWETLDSWKKGLIIFSWILYFGLEILDIRKWINTKNIENELWNWKKESYTLLDLYLQKIWRDLGFHSDSHWVDSRITLYKKNWRWFFCVSRYSDSEELRKKSKNLYKYGSCPVTG